MDNDDEFDFSDDGLDDLPANTLQQLEAHAIQATHHPGHHDAPASDYGLEDDGDEVINLDEQTIVPQAATESWVSAEAPHFAQPPQHEHDYNQDDANGYEDANGAYDYAMEVEEQPRRSQADVNTLLMRIKKVYSVHSLRKASADGCS